MKLYRVFCYVYISNEALFSLSLSTRYVDDTSVWLIENSARIYPRSKRRYVYTYIYICTIAYTATKRSITGCANCHC